jgi:hypothetical protein
MRNGFRIPVRPQTWGETQTTGCSGYPAWRIAYQTLPEVNARPIINALTSGPGAPGIQAVRQGLRAAEFKSSDSQLVIPGAGKNAAGSTPK